MSEKKGTRWKLMLMVIVIVYLAAAAIKLASENEKIKPQNTNNTYAKPTTNKQKKCEKVGILHSAKWWSNELGRPESSVLSSFKINVWSKPDEQGKGVKVGEMLPGSHANIIGETKESYRIKSPFDGSTGWVNKMQFDGIDYQNIITRRPCVP